MSDTRGMPPLSSEEPPGLTSGSSPAPLSSPMSSTPQATYSEKLKVNVVKSERLKRKVLEINLLLDQGMRPNMEKDTVAKLCSKLGIQIQSQMEGYQLAGKKIYIWLKANCDIDRFCSQDSIKVADGIKTGLVKPMDRREVDVKVSGLNLNTPDSLVVEYLNKHGRVVNSKVIYETDKEGPFKGLYNGDRRYLVDFTDGRNLGSFHLLDGARIRVNYSGQRKTCGRCHMTSLGCPGGGIAKVCEDKDGPRVTLINHMKLHWNEIGFTPTSFTLDTKDTEEGVENTDSTDFDIAIKENEIFTPAHKKQNAPSQTDCNYTGVVIRNLPLNITEEILKPFLVSKGLPEEHEELKIFATKKNKNVDIENISNDTCGKLIANIHEQVFFSRKVYCRGLKNLETPTKIAPEEKSKDTTDNTSKPDPDTKIVDSKDATPDKDIETIENKKDSMSPLVPGLSKEEAAKAAKKARQHKNKLDKQKGVKNIGKKSKDLDKSDFLNDSNPPPSPESDQTSAFVFDDNPESPLTETSDDASKFFQNSPLSTEVDPIFLTPGHFSSLTAKKIQKEELWKQQISPKPANKRSSSPSEDLERRMRSRSVSASTRIPMTSKLPFVNTAK